MKRLLLLLTIAAAAQAQTSQRPDCTFPFSFPVGTSLPSNMTPFDNRVAGCTTWQIIYNSYTYSALSLIVQTAPNVTPGTPGSWSTFTAVTGSNPNTNTTSGVATFGGPTSYFPWVRVRLTSGTGAGVISGQLYGWRIPPEASVIIPAGTLCPAGTPCVVDGPVAAGSAATTPPVLMGGQTGDNSTPGTIRVIRLDATGYQQVTGPCTLSLPFNLSGSGSTVVIPISSTTIIDVCGFSLSTTATEDIKLVYGTGAACVTSPADMTGLYKSVQSMVLDFPMRLSTTAGQAVCINQSAAQATGGVIFYARR